ncbi:MAG: sulfatase-like hydrolase/transferase, partial [Verrucomicrobiae bacterium]|nr:sulfatase-like hydrolase/transferase [Verrucomicrobiae bacterium]NNJ87207.1 sulfatase-like hydrolase/transferase [Akkermansiaceae bacterium]
KGTSGAGLYGDFIHDVDYSVGQFIQALKDNGQYENTLFIFTSDNGGDIPKNKKWPEYKAFEMGFNYNGNNRGDKHSIYEGGLKVPFIVSWPAQIKSGAQSGELVTTVDIYGTVAEVLTGALPDPVVGAPDSFSFYHILKDAKQKAVRPFLVHRDAQGRQALRKGKWKLISNVYPHRYGQTAPKTRGKKELYNLEIDPLEANNLFNEFPEIAQELEKLLETARTVSSTREMTQE